MAFDKDGFLSSTMDGFRGSVREVPTYKCWFDFAEDLNRLGWAMLDGHETTTSDNQRLLISVLFIRAHQSFQAAILLIERGMLSDARVVLRSATEGAIALNALANDPAFDMQLIEAHWHTQRRTGRIVLSNATYREQHSADEIAQIEKTVADIDTKEKAAGHSFREVVWANVAAKHCLDLYDLIYRSLSHDGTHTNVAAVHRFLKFDASGGPTALRFGPTTHDLVDVARMACLMFLWAADPFARAHALKFKPQIETMIQRLEELPCEEPADVSVEARFAGQE